MQVKLLPLRLRNKINILKLMFNVNARCVISGMSCRRPTQQNRYNNLSCPFPNTDIKGTDIKGTDIGRSYLID